MNKEIKIICNRCGYEYYIYTDIKSVTEINKVKPKKCNRCKNKDFKIKEN